MSSDQGFAVKNDPQSIYADLLAALASSSGSGQPAKFEILLESHALPPHKHVLVEDDTIGIPRKSLRKAYLVARQKFFNELENLTPDSETILAASAVLLLYEPEHLTAANARKRILLVGLEKSTGTYVRNELWLLDSLFQSPLHRHTKSPTLWGHRRWLMQRIPRFQLVETKKEITDVIFSAAQIHPKNFYAWDYMRWWACRYPELLSNREDLSNSPGNVVDKYLVQLICRWCLMNTSDTSGWSFLLWILTFHDYHADIIKAVAKRVLDAATTLKLRNESLWFFLRSLMASKHMTSDLRQAFLNEAKFIAQSENEKTLTFLRVCGNDILGET